MNAKVIFASLAAFIAIMGAVAFVADSDAIDSNTTILNDTQVGWVGEDGKYAMTVKIADDGLKLAVNYCEVNGEMISFDTGLGYIRDKGLYAVVSPIMVDLSKDKVEMNITDIEKGNIYQYSNIDYKINKTVTGGVINAVDTARLGQEVTFTVTANPGFTLKDGSISVKDKNSKVIEVEDNKFTMPASAVTISAEFEQDTDAEKCKISFDETIESVTVNGTAVSAVPAGTVVTVKAVEKTGQVATVSPALDEKNQYKVTKDVQFKATYSEKEYEDASFSGSILTSTVFGKDQLVTVPKDSVLQDGTTIIIEGKLYVPAGITVKVSAGAKLIINGIADIQGNLEVEGADNDSTPVKAAGEFAVEGKGEATISGTVNVDGVFATYGNGKIVIKSAAEVAGEIFGNIEVSEDATLTVTGLISEKQTRTTGSDVNKTVFTVYGNLTVASDIPTIGFDVVMKKDGTLDIENTVLGTTSTAVGEASGIITVTDDGVFYNDKDDKKTEEVVGKNNLVITGQIKVEAGDGDEGAYRNAFDYGAAVSGITVSVSNTVTKVTEEGAHKDLMKHVSVMAVSGNVTVGEYVFYDEVEYDGGKAGPVAVEDTLAATVTATGAEESAVKIDKDLSFGADIDAGFTNVDVAAPVTFDKELTLDNAAINAAVTVPTGAKITLGGTIDVKAAVDASATDAKDKTKADLVVDADAVITVSGEGSILTAEKPINEKQINATVYGKYVYVSFDRAIAALNAGTTKTVSVLGNQVLTADAEIPAISNAVVMKDGSHLDIGTEDKTDVTLTIASGNGVVLKNSGSKGIEVYGTLYAVKMTNIDSSLRNGTIEDKAAIGSDVYSCALNAKGDVDANGFAKWTNIYTALDTAESGQTVTLKRDIDGLKSAAVKDGVTFDVNGMTVMVAQKATLTVTGTLDLTDSGSEIVLAKPTLDDAGKIKTAGGAIAVEGYVTFTTGGLPIYDEQQDGTLDDATVPGAYYTITDSKNVTTVYLTTYANGIADAVKADSLDDEVKCHYVDFVGKDGKVELGDFTVTGEKDAPVIFGVYDDLVVGTATMNYAGISVVSGKKVSGVFADANGSISVMGESNGIGVGNFDVAGTPMLYITGQVKDYTTEKGAKVDTSIQFSGKVLLGDLGVNVDKAIFASGSDVALGCTETDDNKGFESLFVNITGIDVGFVDETEVSVEGAVAVRAGSEMYVGEKAKLTVSGSIVIEKGALTVDGEATVSGSINATAKKEGDSATATFDVLYIGVDSKILKKEQASTGAAASVTGDVTVDNYALVAPGATVPEAFTEEGSVYKSTVFVVDGKEYVIAYVNSGAAEKLKIGKIDYKPENADFDHWMNGDKIVDGDDVGTIDKVTAKINYNIYTVKIVVGDGIENVAIDGNLVTGGMMSGLKAGTHTVTYSVGFGYTGTATLTVNGEKQSGMTFTASGTSDADRTVKLQLSGIVASSYEPAPIPTPAEDDGLSITDYLLIVLVVLIVIMAVIVAMRLMRS